MKIRTEVLAVLDRVRVDGTTVFLPEKLDRKLYLSVNDVLTAMGGKWNRKAKGHVFDGDPTASFEATMLAGEISTRDDLGFFPTPAPLAARLVAAAGIRRGMSVLEPSAGDGALLRALPSDIGEVVAVELDATRADRLTEAFPHVAVAQDDFLSMGVSHVSARPGPFDRVAMNPPFARQQDIDHVRHAHGFLKPGGRLAAIMGGGVTFRQNKKSVEFRDFVAEHDGEIESLPAGSFTPSGTDVHTVLVVMDA